MQIYKIICIIFIIAYVGNLHKDYGVTLDVFFNNVRGA